MGYSRRLLSSSSNLTSNAQPPEAMNLQTDFVVVVAALVCAIICVLGLVVAARCAFLRRGVDRWSFSFGVGGELANKGLKKKVLNSFPKYTHNSDATSAATEVAEDCAICLAEYGDGDVVRVLPQCGHRFHAHCIDTWLASHSSCPSCRKILVVTRCHKCGEFPTVCEGGTGAGGGGAGAGAGFVPAKLTPISSAASTSSLTFLP